MFKEDFNKIKIGDLYKNHTNKHKLSLKELFNKIIKNFLH